MSRLVPILLVLAWLTPGDAAAQEDTDDQGETSETPSTELHDGQTVTVPGAPFRTNAQWWSTSRAPFLGEHTEMYIN